MKYLKPFKESKSEYVQYFKYKIVRKEPIENLYKYKDHRRLRVFYEKGTTCCQCGVVGTLIVHGLDKGKNIHVDVCTDDYYPLTIDHILPRSKGGSDDLENLRPMCCICNWERGDDSGRKFPVHIKKHPKEPFSPDKVKSEIKVGDVVYKKVNNELVGEVIDIKTNPQHPNNSLSCQIKGRHPSSLYNLKALYAMNESKNNNWDKYIQDQYNLFIQECEPEKSHMDDINLIFNQLQDEVDDSESIDVYEVISDYEYVMPNVSGEGFLGLVKAMSPLDAIIKMSIIKKDTYTAIAFLDEESRAEVIDEEVIDGRIESLKKELELLEVIH